MNGPGQSHPTTQLDKAESKVVTAFGLAMTVVALLLMVAVVPPINAFNPNTTAFCTGLMVIAVLVAAIVPGFLILGSLIVRVLGQEQEKEGEVTLLGNVLFIQLKYPCVLITATVVINDLAMMAEATTIFLRSPTWGVWFQSMQWSYVGSLVVLSMVMTVIMCCYHRKC